MTVRAAVSSSFPLNLVPNMAQHTSHRGLRKKGPLSSTQPKALKVGDLASLFGVNERTIHNWCDPGRIRSGDPIPHWTTPGGHKRFDPRSVLEWARARAYRIPPELLTAAGLPAEQLAAQALAQVA